MAHSMSSGTALESAGLASRPNPATHHLSEAVTLVSILFSFVVLVLFLSVAG